MIEYKERHPFLTRFASSCFRTCTAWDLDLYVPVPAHLYLYLFLYLPVVVAIKRRECREPITGPSFMPSSSELPLSLGVRSGDETRQR